MQRFHSDTRREETEGETTPIKAVNDRKFNRLVADYEKKLLFPFPSKGTVTSFLISFIGTQRLFV